MTARLRWVAALAVLAALATAAFAVLRPASELTVRTQFTDTTGLYVGNKVTVLGVKVGEVSAIEPNGDVVDVELTFPADTRIAAGAGAAIMQSSLVADRYVELTPAWDGGPRMGDGDEIPLARTASPVNADDIIAAIDELILALDGTTSEGRDVGDLLEVAADNLDGQGGPIRDALLASQQAMESVTAKEGDLRAVTTSLDTLVKALAARDETVRRFQGNVTAATAMLADQRTQLQATVRGLLEVSTKVTTFVRSNRELVATDLEQAADLLEIVARNEKGLTEMVDVGPLTAENIYRAWDPKTHRLRIRVDTRTAGPFGFNWRRTFCQNLGVLGDCAALTNQDGTGLLDPILNFPTTLVPDNW